MKQLLTLILLTLLFIPKGVHAQIHDVIVEKYYISDSLDATDSTNWFANAGYPTHYLERGSITYRVYVQLDSGYKLRKVWGSECHPFKVKSTAVFYNNISRPDELYGYMIRKQFFYGNPLLAIDSWLTIGKCAVGNGVNPVQYMGVPKDDDYDGSLIGGSSHNGGGTAGISVGLIVNNDTAAHIPVDTADGMVPTIAPFPGWVDFGFTEVIGGNTTDTTTFGSINVDSVFISTNGYLQQNGGVTGDSAAGHKVLVGQFTTKGELTFELNLELMDSTGGIHNGDLLNFVATASNCDTVGMDTTVLGMLKYPRDIPICGCGDPFFVEYNPNAPCFNDSVYCLHRIVFGCMDTLACNYDANANFNIPSLCCYPGRCNDRDISLVCPGVTSLTGFKLFPNPAVDILNIEINAGINQEVKYTIYDSFGIIVEDKDLGIRTGVVTPLVDVSTYQIGLYLVRVTIGGSAQSKTFMKN